ncbi:vWA domain-containing protein [Halomicrobium sp. LC1Hm]|uniref:vWA domain-containing protein n=1 Tax=Halomicrobium sp. LC1Hm TaxID=2610902 RepID=UPI0012982BF1|nr:vWA domain-containing protein [Halomicrobium sp. LC1Hm]QGA84405.1 von Willebrand factor type A [Halomicrobium sp. LC1Hm]
MRLTAQTEAADLAALSTPERASSERRRELERLASLCTDRETTISIAFDEQRAFARPAEGSPDAYEIVLPTEKYEQPGTALPPGLWDRSIQVAFLFHELGHVYYSDFDRFGDRLERVDGRWRDLFRMVYNTAEDGVVETQIANEFSVSDDFLVLNDVLVSRADERHRAYVELFDLATVDGEPVQSYTVFEALAVGLLDRGFVDSGRFAAIVDPDDDRRVVYDGQREAVRELVPAMDEFVADVLSEPDGTRRVERASEFFETARDTLAGLPPRQNGRLQTAPVRPSDARARAGWTADAADQLPDDGAASAHVAGDSSADGRSASEANDAGRVADRDGDRRPPGSVEADTVRRVRRQRVRAQSNRAGSGRSPLEREARELLAVVDDESTALEEVIVVDPAEDGGDRDRWDDAVGRSKQLQRDLSTQLRRERRPRDAPGHRTGRLDGRRLVDASHGTQRVFTRRESGTAKDYSCLVVLDRSGSMDGEPIRTAETATAQLVHALFAVGVDASVLSIWEGYPCLELPFGGRPSEHVDRLMTERADWGTPLSTAVAVARERLDDGQGSHPFVVVVTDGEPDHPDRYRSQLAACTVPVFGVYIGSEPGTHTEYFDRIVHAETDTLARTIQRLVRALFSTEA